MDSESKDFLCNSSLLQYVIMNTVNCGESRTCLFVRRFILPLKTSISRKVFVLHVKVCKLFIQMIFKLILVNEDDFMNIKS